MNIFRWRPLRAPDTLLLTYPYIYEGTSQLVIPNLLTPAIRFSVHFLARRL
jgi:hypothetical protein